MVRSSIFPGRYIQGENALAFLGKEIARLGDNVLCILTSYAYNNLTDLLKDTMKGTVSVGYERFGGECSDEEIERITEIADKMKVNVIVGIGGGKTLDTAKVTAYNMKVPVVIVPTIASTDAPCSANSVIYTPEGEFKRYFMLPKNPDLVLVDTRIVAGAPVRFLTAGMGDALSTRFEAESCRQKYAGNLTGYPGSTTAYAMASLCYDLLMEYGISAKMACEVGAVTPALDHIVEANTLLSGLGFESGGLAAAHAIHNGLTVLPQTHSFYHGEKVAIGTLASLFLVDRDSSIIKEVYRFCQAVGLPTTLADIGLADCTDRDLMRVSEASCREEDTMCNEPSPVTPMDVFNAIKTADAYGRALKK